MLIRVASYVTAIEAHLARGRLEAEGIPAFVCHEHHVGIDWPIAFALMLIKVYVHRNDVERAAEVIAAHDRGDFALPDETAVACPRCQGEQIVQRRMSWKSALLVVHVVHLPLYFVWATRKCLNCGHEWDLTNTRAYPLALVGVAAILVSAIVIFIFTPYCLDGQHFWLVFPLRGGCSH